MTLTAPNSFENLQPTQELHEVPVAESLEAGRIETPEALEKCRGEVVSEIDRQTQNFSRETDRNIEDVYRTDLPEETVDTILQENHVYDRLTEVNAEAKQLATDTKDQIGEALGGSAPERTDQVPGQWPQEGLKESRKAVETAELPVGDFLSFLEKNKKLQNVRGDIEKATDARGMPIDEGIKELVVMLNAFDISTTQSCEGHINQGTSAPWIRIEAPNEPEERFVGQKEIYQKVAEKYGIPAEDITPRRNMRAWKEAAHESAKNDETPEFKKWWTETQKLAGKANDMLQEFYQGRDATPDVRLQLSEGATFFEINNGGDDQRPAPKDLSDKEKQALAQRLSSYQREMGTFMKFLKKKFLLRNT